MNDVVYRVEKSATAAKLTQKFNFRKQVVRWLSKNDSTPGGTQISKDNMRDRNGFTITHNNNYNVKILEELSTDSNGVVTGKISHSYYARDTMPNGDFGVGLKFEEKNANPIDKQMQFLMHRTDAMGDSNVMNDIFDELVSIRVYHDFNPHIDTGQIDSIVTRALNDKNIHIPFHFAILNSTADTVLTASKTGMDSKFLQSPYKVNLSPKTVFIQHVFFRSYFHQKPVIV